MKLCLSFAALFTLGSLALAPPQDPAAPPTPVQVELERDVSVLYEGALVGAIDGEDFNETPGYRRLIEIVARYTEEELNQKARELDFPALMADPDAWRGEIVKWRGLLIELTTERLQRPLGERIDVFRAIVIEMDGSDGVIVDFVEPMEQPPPIDLERDVVDVEGIFFRTVRYESEQGTFREAPLLIARSLRRPDPESLPRRTALEKMGFFLIAAAVVYGVVRILSSVRGSKSTKERDARAARHASRMIRERARILPPSSPPPPSSTPSTPPGEPH